MREKFYITTPIYYASGEPHIGHAFTIIFADVIARHKRQKDFNVFFLTGTDEHGSKIIRKAKLAGKNPKEYVDGISKLYADLWELLQIQNSDFIRTTSERHKAGVEKFIEKLWQAGDIYQGEYEGLYCVDCENFILEKDLVNGLCQDHLLKPELVKEKNYFFNLNKYIPVVKEKIISNELKIIPESRKNEALNILSGDLPDFSITREKVQWGIPFPNDKKQTIYVWVDALINYLSALDFPDGEKFKKYWPADVHIIGADINKFHSIYWTALLMSANVMLPKKIFAHGLLTVNGQKMSKTLGNIINPKVLIEKFGSDATRYLLLSQFPAFEHGDIKESEFAEKYNADLANGAGNLFERVFAMAKQSEKSESLPNVPNESELDNEVVKFINETKEKYRARMENFQLYEALKEVFILIKFLDRYINEKQPWKRPKNLPQILNSLVLGVEEIIVLLSPFMPSKMEAAKDFLNRLESGKIKPDEKLNLFPRV
jgi:methionyl-tRNA synthetase